MAFLVADHPAIHHGVDPFEILDRRQRLIDKPFGATVAAGFEVLPRLVQGDVRALPAEQRLSDP